MLDAKQISDRLKRENSIALFCHIRPDGDTLGSALALKKALVKTGVRAEVFCDDVIPEKFFFNPTFSEVKNCDPVGFSRLRGDRLRRRNETRKVFRTVFGRKKYL